MIYIRVETNGNSVKQTYSRLSTHPTLKSEMAHLDLMIGDAEINIAFKTWKEMIKFCKDHNFKYEDERNVGNECNDSLPALLQKQADL